MIHSKEDDGSQAQVSPGEGGDEYQDGIKPTANCSVFRISRTDINTKAQNREAATPCSQLPGKREAHRKLHLIPRPRVHVVGELYVASQSWGIMILLEGTP